MVEARYELGTGAGCDAGGSAGCGGGVGTMSSKKPGRNRSMRSCVAAHTDAWRSLRTSSGEVGGTSSPVAFITSSTFFRDSGTASYFDAKC